MDFTKLKDVELSLFPTDFLSVNNVSMYPWNKVLYS